LASSLAITGLAAALIHLDGGHAKCQFIDELTGLAHTQPAVAAAVALCVFSLAGAPPLLGFWSQAAICWTALAAHAPSPTVLVTFHRGFLIAACAGLVGGLLMAAVAIRVCGVMFFQSPLSRAEPSCPPGAKAIAIVVAAAIIACGLVPHVLWKWLTGQ